MEFFTDLYKDELVYSSIARLVYYTRSTNSKKVLKDIFNDSNCIPSLNIGSHFDTLVENINGEYTVEKLIYAHTIYPYYESFIPAKRQKQLLHIMKSKNGKSLYNMLGTVAGGICKKEGIYYCPKCVEADEETYGECYSHREHQLEGVLVCPHHGIYLRKYYLDKSNSGRIEFIRLDSKNTEKEEAFIVDSDDVKDILFKLSQMAYKLLVIHKNTDQKKILVKYKKLLAQKGFVNISGRIKQNELYEAFIGFYDKKVLHLLESDIDNEYEYNWLRVITRNSKRTVHPIRHLLFINFLGMTLEEFFGCILEEFKPFGEGPWPCLNPIAEHYKQDVVEDMVLSMDYKVKRPVATLSCSCGFVYSRMGPDNNISDRYKIGRKKQFGEVWESKLKAYLQKGTYGLREVARMMQCDPKTVLKFDQRWKIGYFSQSQKREVEIQDELIQKPIPAICKEVVCNKQIEYCKHQKEKVHKNRVDWNERDQILMQDFMQAYEELSLLEKPIRITRTRLAKKLGLDGSIDKIIDKLPCTKEYIDTVQESISDFQLRRCKWIVDKLLQSEESIKMWKIQRAAGIRKQEFSEIVAKVEAYVEHKCSY